MASLMGVFSTMHLSIWEACMDIRWRFALGKFFVWLAAEIILSMLGIDDLADYSEFIFEKNVTVLIAQELKLN